MYGVKKLCHRLYLAAIKLVSDNHLTSESASSADCNRTPGHQVLYQLQSRPKYDPSAISDHSWCQAQHTSLKRGEGVTRLTVFMVWLDTCLLTCNYWVGTSVPYAGTNPSCVFLYFIMR